MFEWTNKIDVSLVKWMGDDNVIVNAARVSTMGDASLGMNEDARGLIKYLMKNRHGSPFEHNAMTFLVRAPLFVWREHHRHRVGFSYNEESARYRQLDPSFYLPEVARTQIGRPGHYDIVDNHDVSLNMDMVQWIKEANGEAWAAYTHMLDAGIAREVARMVLPVNIMSSCYVSCNVRSLMHFLSLRTKDARAVYPSKPQLEIDMLARQYEHHFSRMFPITWNAFNEFGRVAP